MSARVFNPYTMSEVLRFMRDGGHLDLGESEIRSPRDNSSRESIRKCLFGPPSQGERKYDLQKEMESHWEKASKKWNFDFKAGKPLPPGEDCVYEWKVLKSKQAVPEAYALARLPYLKSHADNNQPVKSGTEVSQSCPPSSSSFTSSTRIQTRSNTDVQSSNKQTVITDFMRKQKTMKRVSSALKSESVPSGKEEEPTTKKARTFEFKLKL